MRIWYVVGNVEYWLEPEVQVGRTNRLRVLGCKMYDAKNHYKGYWHWKDMPLEVKRNVRSNVLAGMKRIAEAEKKERQWVKGYYRRPAGKD